MAFEKPHREHLLGLIFSVRQHQLAAVWPRLGWNGCREKHSAQFTDFRYSDGFMQLLVEIESPDLVGTDGKPSGVASQIWIAYEPAQQHTWACTD